MRLCRLWNLEAEMPLQMCGQGANAALTDFEISRIPCGTSVTLQARTPLRMTVEVRDSPNGIFGSWA